MSYQWKRLAHYSRPSWTVSNINILVTNSARNFCNCLLSFELGWCCGWIVFWVMRSNCHVYSVWCIVHSSSHTVLRRQEQKLQSLGQTKIRSEWQINLCCRRRVPRKMRAIPIVSWRTNRCMYARRPESREDRQKSFQWVTMTAWLLPTSLHIHHVIISFVSSIYTSWTSSFIHPVYLWNNHETIFLFASWENTIFQFVILQNYVNETKEQRISYLLFLLVVNIGYA